MAKTKIPKVAVDVSKEAEASATNPREVNVSEGRASAEEAASDAGRKRTYFSLDKLSPSHRRKVLAVFASEVRKLWSSEGDIKSDSESSDEQEKTSVMDAVTKAAVTQKIISEEVKIHPRQFTTFFKALFQSGELRVGTPSASEKGLFLRTRTPWGPKLREIVVAPGSDKDVFEELAAEHFVGQLFLLGERKKQRMPGKPLNVGIVSGHTVAGVLGKVLEMEWAKRLAFSANQLPEVRVYALNVCLTVDDHLAGNANILAHLLRAKIKREQGHAKAYGLSAPLLVEKERLQDVDRAPQTKEVVKVTEPYRLPELRKAFPKPSDTDLDIILTGVGELPISKAPGQSGSIFYNLAAEFGFKMDDLVKRERIVGDIAFSAIRADGEPVALRRHIDSPKIIQEDLRDLPGLIRELNNRRNPVSKHLLGGLFGSRIESLCKSSDDQQALQDAVINVLNEIILALDFEWSDATKDLPLHQINGAAQNDKALLNRLVLEAAYVQLIAPVGTEFVFYSAVQLPVLDGMANDDSENKAVILLARHDKNKYKVPSIYASVAGVKHRYVSQLVIDEDTALNLLLLSAPDWITETEAARPRVVGSSLGTD